MKNLKKPIIIALVLIFIVIVVGCIWVSKRIENIKNAKEATNTVNTTTTDENVIENTAIDNTVENEIVNSVVENTVSNTAESQEVLSNRYEVNARKQLAMPEVGETIAIFNVRNYGQIVVKFFEESAPKAVENFITHAREGYYNGLTFHRVINEFMIQGGDPNGDGTGGETIWGEDIGEEIDSNLVPYRGALMMASRGTGTKSIGSQFFIVQANYDNSMRRALKSSGWDSDLLEAYRNHGGYMTLYGSYTLFGQVISGMDVVDKIAAVQTAPDIDKPLQDVVIESIEVTTYQGE